MRDRRINYLLLYVVATATILALLYANELAARSADVAAVAYKNRAFKNPFIRVYRGPFNARVERVIDADTVSVSVYPWPAISIKTKVRLRGVDTPEQKRSKCPDEKTLAEQATTYVKSVLEPGTRVQITDVSFGKYSDRVIGDLMIESPGDKWVSMSDTLLAAGYAKPYLGGKKPRWCP